MMQVGTFISTLLAINEINLKVRSLFTRLDEPSEVYSPVSLTGGLLHSGVNVLTRREKPHLHFSHEHKTMSLCLSG